MLPSLDWKLRRDAGEKRRGKRRARGFLNMGRQAQIVPVYASMTDHMVAGIGSPEELLRWFTRGIEKLTCCVVAV